MGNQFIKFKIYNYIFENPKEKSKSVTFRGQYNIVLYP